MRVPRPAASNIPNMSVKLRPMRAVVDIGSNSIKYLLATYCRGALDMVGSQSWVTRLGKGLETNGGYFEEASLLSTEMALKEMGATFRSHRKIEKLTVVATAAARKAKNVDRLAGLVEKYLNVKLKIISGDEEALWSMKGAQQAAKQNFPRSSFVFLDVGGASTEIGFLDPHFHAHSFEGGALRCHEGLGLDKMPVSDDHWNDARIEIKRYFPEDSFKRLLSSYTPDAYQAVAVGGTLLLATEYCENLMRSKEGHLVERIELENLAQRMRTKSLRDRQAIAGMDQERADILPAGILVLTSCLTRLGQEKVFITPWGLRHGLLSWEDS